MKMTKWFAAAAVLSVTALSFADITVHWSGSFEFTTSSPGTVSLNWAGGNPEHWQGGAFAVTGVLGHFDTFCTEWNTANLSFDHPYYASVDTVIVEGDATHPTALTNGAAWIYSQFRSYGYNLGSATTFSDQQISQAIWYYLGDTAVTPASGLAALVTGAMSDPFETDHIGNVRVLNLWDIPGTPVPGGTYSAADIQSQLTMIPVPAAALLGVLGLGLVGWVKRRLA